MTGVPESWIPVEMELDAEVLAHFQALGPDWEVRMNDTLKRAIEAGIG